MLIKLGKRPLTAAISALALVFASHLLTGCTHEVDATVMSVPAPGDSAAYQVVDDSLEPFISDFNAAAGKLRLVFLSGPSCGICLRGMDDLNRSIVADVQADPRIQTFVVYVPTLGATEQHAADAIPLMQGPRVSHYWDGPGHSGLEFQATLEIPMYAWDIWMLYGPDATWKAGATPPVPPFWHHQLPGLPSEQRLDAGKFADRVRQELAALPPASPEQLDSAATAGAEPGRMRVAQPRSHMIKHNHLSRGGYDRIKSLQSVEYIGETVVGGRSLPLKVITERPGRYRRTVSGRTTTWDGKKLAIESGAAGLDSAYLEDYLTSYDFDGWMTDWKVKGHRLWRLGMDRLENGLYWVMEAELANGRTWHLFVASHTGDIERQVLLDDAGKEALRIEFDDFREVGGTRLPFEIRYFRNGSRVATDLFKQAVVEDTAPSGAETAGQAASAGNS